MFLAPESLFLIQGGFFRCDAVWHPCRRDQPTGELLSWLCDWAAAEKRRFLSETSRSGLALTPALWVGGICQPPPAGPPHCSDWSEKLLLSSVSVWKLLPCVLSLAWEVKTKERHILKWEELSFLQTDKPASEQTPEAPGEFQRDNMWQKTNTHRWDSVLWHLWFKKLHKTHTSVLNVCLYLT